MDGTLSKIARGVSTRPSPQTLQRVAAAFGVTVAWLVGEEPAPVSPATDGPTTELDDRYPSRREAMLLLAGVVPQQVLDAVAVQSLESRSDPGLEHWTNEIRRLARLRNEIAHEIEVDIPPPRKR